MNTLRVHACALCASTSCVCSVRWRVEVGAYCAVGEPLSHPRDTQLANTCNGETLTSRCTKFICTRVAQCCSVFKQYIQNHLMAQCTQIGGRSSQELWSCRARAAGCYVFCRLACLGPICVIRPSPPAAAKHRAAKIWGKSAKKFRELRKMRRLGDLSCPGLDVSMEQTEFLELQLASVGNMFYRQVEYDFVEYINLVVIVCM